MTFTLYRIRTSHTYWWEPYDYDDERSPEWKTTNETELVFGAEEAFKCFWKLQRELCKYGPEGMKLWMESALVLPGSEKNWTWTVCCSGVICYDSKKGYIYREKKIDKR